MTYASKYLLMARHKYILAPDRGLLTAIGFMYTILMFGGIWPSLLYPATLLAGILLVIMGYVIEKPIKY